MRSQVSRQTESRDFPGSAYLLFSFSAQHLSEAVSILISKDGGNDKEHKKSVAKEKTGNNSFYVGAFIARFQLDKAVHTQRQHKENRKPDR